MFVQYLAFRDGKHMRLGARGGLSDKRIERGGEDPEATCTEGRPHPWLFEEISNG